MRISKTNAHRDVPASSVAKDRDTVTSAEHPTRIIETKEIQIHKRPKPEAPSRKPEFRSLGPSIRRRA
jgi:hypothetical protein